MDLIDALDLWSHPMSLIKFIKTKRTCICDQVYKNDQLNKIIKDNETSNFDVLMIENVGYDCDLYLANKLNLPLIYLISSPMVTFAERSIFGDIPNPAIISHLYADHAIPMTFVQRFLNTALLGYSMILFGYDKWVRQYTANRPYDLETSTVRPSLTFVNSHFISEASRPFPQNFIQVGGIHLKPPKSIPNDILEFIENSPHGVIVFTLGSVVNMSTSPDYIMNPLKEALAEVPQRILWKYEAENMVNKPKNVMIRKWLPQRDILLHPNVKLFISHGGMSGVYETVDAGVPVLGFPLFYDQPRNIANLVNAGMAISMDILSVKKDTFLRNVLELVNDKKYMRNAKIASDIFKNRPMSAEQSILFWTEYVIRHKGAPHLLPHSLNLTWYQYLLLDVIAAMIVFLTILNYDEETKYVVRIFIFNSPTAYFRWLEDITSRIRKNIGRRNNCWKKSLELCDRDNYTEIDTSNDHATLVELNLVDAVDLWGPPMAMIEFIRTKRIFMCDAVYKSVQLNKLIEEKEHLNFDVLIIETLGYDCELYLAI
eukprot:XP_016663759.1 PREDICTED: UDP-glucuronosyltransferase 2B2-like [Acyrthosiphon pisum]